MSRLALLSLGFAASLLAAAPARATLQLFTIDPSQSYVDVAGTEAEIDLGPLLGTLVLGAQPQAGNVGGASGALLGDGTVGDGLRTTLEGQLLVDLEPGSIRFLTPLTDIRLQTSGDWLPDVGGTPVAPAAGQLGLLMTDGAGFDALAAVRDAAFLYASALLPLVAAGGGASSFDAAQTFELAAGRVDYDDPLTGSGAASLDAIAAANGASGGLFESPGGGFQRITIPVDLTLPLGPEFFAGLPLTVNLHLAGQIVATQGIAPLPEPGAALLLATAGLAFVMGRRRRLRPVAPGLALALLVFALSSGCEKDHRPCGDECGINVELVCTDLVDDDLDGLVDCADPDCAAAPNCQLEDVCNDGIDDEGDGYTDCEDADCADDPACMAVPEICNNGIDDDLDGPVDCDDSDCAASQFCAPEVCDNGVDDDADGFGDCADAECEGFYPGCPLEACGSGSDDDGDGWTDCDDADCSGNELCPGEVCDDGTDDDGDGDTDCDDADCATSQLCSLEICDNLVDDDLDGYVDCDDSACDGDPACPTELCSNGVDDDGDGFTDCTDAECSGHEACPGERCDGFIDADGDGHGGCDDLDCAGTQPCVPEICDNGTDEDGDGFLDCFDADCDGDGACGLEACGNGIDDDGDGFADCIDPDCAGAQLCVSETCDNGIDDNGDGYGDCNDFDCAFDPACQGGEDCNNGEDDDGDAVYDCADDDCAAAEVCDAGEICGNGVDDEGDGLVDGDDPDCVDAVSSILSVDCFSTFGLFATAGSTTEMSNACGGTADAIEGTSRTLVTMEEDTSGDHELSIVTNHQRDAAILGVGAGDATIDVTYGPGGDRLWLGVRQFALGSADHAAGATFVECPPGGSASFLPDDGSAGQIPASPQGGTCRAYMDAGGCISNGAGDGACHVIFYALDPGAGCTHDGACGAELCGPDGFCQDGGAFDPCASVYDCDTDAGFACTTSEMCGDGRTGSPCNEDLGDFECAPGYTCRSGFCRFAEVEPNDDASVATALGILGSETTGVAGQIDPANDEDWWSFDLPSAGSLEAFAFSDDELDMFLVDGLGETLAWDADCNPCTFATRRLESGPFYLEVDGDGHGAAYGFDLDFEPACGNGVIEALEECDDGNVDPGDGCDESCQVESRAEVSPNEDSTEAQLLGDSSVGGLAASGAYDGFGDHDWYRFHVTEPAPGAEVTADVVLLQGPAGGGLFVYDEALTLLGTQSSCSVCLLQDVALAAGDYFVEVADGFDGGAYDLLVSVDPSTCGDGFLAPDEDCDDGNTTAGDGCDESCLHESTFETEPNQTTGEATPVGALSATGLRAAGSFGGDADEIDHFSFEVVGAPASLGVLYDGDEDVDLLLVGPDLSDIDQDLGCDPCGLSAVATEDGTYYIRVEPIASDPSPSSYGLQIREE